MKKIEVSLSLLTIFLSSLSFSSDYSEMSTMDVERDIAYRIKVSERIEAVMKLEELYREDEEVLYDYINISIPYFTFFKKKALNKRLYELGHGSIRRLTYSYSASPASDLESNFYHISEIIEESVTNILGGTNIILKHSILNEITK